jgi:hypothetical protein
MRGQLMKIKRDETSLGKREEGIEGGRAAAILDETSLGIANETETDETHSASSLLHSASPMRRGLRLMRLHSASSPLHSASPMRLRLMRLGIIATSLGIAKSAIKG